MFLLTDIRVAQDVETFGIGRHHAVLDAVVNHFDKVARTVGTAMEIAVLGGAARGLFASGGWRRGFDWRSERRKNRIEMLDDVGFASNHLAEAAVETPYTAARTGVDVMKSLGFECFGATKIVDVVRIAAVHQDVPGLEAAGKTVQSLLDDGRRHHHPCDPRFDEAFGEIVKRGRA